MTPTPKAIDDATAAFDACTSTSPHAKMRAALAAYESAMEAAGFVRVGPWQDISTVPRIEGAQYLAELHWYPPGLDGRQEYREVQYDIIKWTDFNTGGWVRYANGRPVRWRALPIPPAMIAARPSAKGA